MDSQLSKKALRKVLLKARQAIPAEVWRAQSDRLCAHLQASDLFSGAQTVLAYFSFRQEPDLSPLFALPKTWGFPRCIDQSLAWHVWSPQDSMPLQTGAYGIQEPHPSCPPIHLSQVDLVLVPAVACDSRGYRLGYGGGFYDRLLNLPEWSTKPTIGIVFDSARFNNLPTEPWDFPLKAICTESGIIFAD